MPTYDELINNQEFTGRLYDVYKELGYDIPGTNRELVDDFLSKKRGFEDNLVTTLDFSSDVDKLSDLGKQDLGYAMEQVEALPTIFEEGSAPVGSAVLDHVLYSITDPTNIAGAVGGLFTMGGGTAAALAGKQAAKQGLKALLKHRLKTMVSAPVLRAGAVDATISGSGGAYRENEIQNTEIDLGIRDEKDPAEIALTGLIEGPLSVVGGNVIGLTGTIAAGLSKKAVDAGLRIAGEDVERAANRFVSMLTPGGGLGDVNLLRTNERVKGIQKDFIDRSQKLEADFNKNKTYQDIIKNPTSADFQRLNKAIEGYRADINYFRQRDADLGKALDDGRSLIREAQTYGYNVQGINPTTSALFHPIVGNQTNPYYARIIYEAFEKGPQRKVSFNNFIKQNRSLISDLYDTLYRDINAGANSQKYAADLKLPDSMFQSPQMSAAAEKLLTKRAEEMYYGKLGKYDYGATVLGTRQTMDPVFNKIYGANADPARRVFRSVENIIEPMTQLHLTNEIGKTLELSGRAVYAKDATDAANKLFQQTGEYVDPNRLVNLYDSAKAFPSKNGLRGIDGGYFVADTLADRLKFTLTNPRLSLAAGKDHPLKVLDNMINTAAYLQGAIKLGKTAYSPLGLTRNVMSMAFQTAASGNIRGFDKYLAKQFGSRADQEQFKQLMSTLGVRDTGVVFNQLMNRLGEDFQKGNVSAGRIQRVANDIVRARGLGGEKALKVYQLTDDVGKFMSFLSERNRMENIWRSADQNYKQMMRDSVAPLFTKVDMSSGTPVYTRSVFSDADVLDELAVRKTLDIMPTYSRVPMITEYLRGFPVVGNFMSFAAESVRNGINIMRIAHQEMIDGYATGNSALVRAGQARLMSMLGANAGLYGAVYAMNEAEGFGDTVEALRNYLAPWERDHPILITGVEKTKDNVRITYRDVGYSNPFNMLGDLAGAVIGSAATGRPIEEALAERGPAAAAKLFEPFLDESLVLQASQEFMRVVSASDDETAKFHIGKLTKIMEPGIVKLGREFVTQAGVMPVEAEKALSPRYFQQEPTRFDPTNMSEVADFFLRQGFNPFFAPEKTFDVNASTGFALREQTKDFRDGWNAFSQDLKQTLSDPSFSSRLNARSIAKAYEEELARQFGIQANIADLLDDMNALTGDESMTRRIMRQPNLRSAMPRSTKEKNRLMHDRSAVQRLSSNKQFWKDVRKMNPELDTSQLRALLRAIERNYDNKNLEGAIPEELPETIFE